MMYSRKILFSASLRYFSPQVLRPSRWWARFRCTVKRRLFPCRPTGRSPSNFSFGASIAPRLHPNRSRRPLLSCLSGRFRKFRRRVPDLCRGTLRTIPSFPAGSPPMLPFFFSANVPEGNYRVSITFDGDSMTTVKAELRRLMLEQISKITPGHPTRTFAVNVHKPPFSTRRAKRSAASK